MEIIIQNKYSNEVETITLEQMLEDTLLAVKVYTYIPNNRRKDKIKEDILKEYFKQITAKQLLGFLDLCKTMSGEKYREIMYDIGKFYI